MSEPEVPPPFDPTLQKEDTEIEVVTAGPPDPRKEWEDAVWEQHRNRCSNCGGEDRLRIKMVVPIDAGGQLVPSNGVVLCRTCEISADSSRHKESDPRRPINFWVSQALYQALQAKAQDTLFKSMASLVRYLMTKYVEDEARFDDLEQYQDLPAAEVKINVWVDRTVYAAFKELVDKRGLTVTDALKALIKLFEAEGVTLGKRME